jgi:hypothetical protein
VADASVLSDQQYAALKEMLTGFAVGKYPSVPSHAGALLGTGYIQAVLGGYEVTASGRRRIIAGN